jgi:hypothetical protein
MPRVSAGLVRDRLRCACGQASSGCSATSSTCTGSFWLEWGDFQSQMPSVLCRQTFLWMMGQGLDRISAGAIRGCCRRKLQNGVRGRRRLRSSPGRRMVNAFCYLHHLYTFVLVDGLKIRQIFALRCNSVSGSRDYCADLAALSEGGQAQRREDAELRRPALPPSPVHVPLLVRWG